MTVWYENWRRHLGTNYPMANVPGWRVVRNRTSSGGSGSLEDLIRAYMQAANMQAQGYTQAAGMISGAAGAGSAAAGEGIGYISNALARGQALQEQGIAKMLEMADRALELQRSMYEQGVSYLKPWRKAGEWALSKLVPQEERGKPGKKNYRPASPGMIEGLMPDTSPEKYVRSPYYDFLLKEGIRARDRAAAARGMTLSGAQQRAIEEYGQGLGKTDYDQWFNREWTNYYNKLLPYQQLSAQGETAAAQSAQMGQNYANAGSNILTGTGANVANMRNSMAGNLLSGAGMQANLGMQGANMAMQGAGMAGNMLANAANAQASGIFNSAYMPYQHNMYLRDLERSRQIAGDIDSSRRRSDWFGLAGTFGPILLQKALSYI